METKVLPSRSQQLQPSCPAEAAPAESLSLLSGLKHSRKRSRPTRWGESSPCKARELPGGARPCSVPCPRGILGPPQAQLHPISPRTRAELQPSSSTAPHRRETARRKAPACCQGAELPFLPPQASPVCTGFLSRLEGSSSPVQLSSAGELKTNGLICAKSRLQLQHLFFLFSFFLIFHTAPDKNEYNYCY